MDLLNNLLRGAIEGFDEPVPVDYKGRKIHYKTKQRIHSFSEPLKTDVTIWDEESDTSVDVNHAGPKDEAIELAKEKLFGKLKELGVINTEQRRRSTDVTEETTNIDQLKSADLITHETIGRGAFSEVFRVTFKGGSYRGHIVAAAKKLNVLRESEVYILRKAKHPNIVSFIDYIEEPLINIIVTEVADESLRARLNRDQISGALQDQWIRESTEAIQYLHNGIPDVNGVRMPVVHRDIKAANCLLFGDRLKISDFGIAKEVDHTTGTISRKGTEPWMAPEVLGLGVTESKFSTASDIYALGVLYWEIFTQELPKALHDGKGTRIWGQPITRHQFPAYVQKLLPLCWRHNYKERPTIGEVITQLP